MKRFLILILAVSMLLPCFVGCGKTEKESGREDDEREEAQETEKEDVYVAMRTENYTITDKMYAYIYYNIYNNYYGYFGDNVTSLLAYIQNNARSQAQQILALCEGARVAGVTLSTDDYETVDENLKEFKKNLIAVEMSISEYFGDVGVTSEDMHQVMLLTALASKYYEEKTEELTASVESDEATLLEYANKNSIKMDTSVTKNVGHILIKVDTGNVGFAVTEDEKKRIEAENEKKYAEALPTAEGYLAEFLSTSKTKEDFERIGEKYTEDSNVFYENVRTGDMVDAFNDWIFDPARRVGDTGIVKTEYGWHVMYFVGDGRLVWVDDAITALVEEQLNALLEDGCANVTMDENIIGVIDGSKK